MKNLKASTAIVLALIATPAVADPTFMLGLAVNFGGGERTSTGLTLKILSDDEADSFVGAAGVTYFFDNGGYLGWDAGIGYLFEDNFATTLTYDFLNNRPQFSIGYADVC
jgi:hypothetical protein